MPAPVSTRRAVTLAPAAGLQPPPGYAFVIQNNKIVTLSGKPVIRKVA